RNPRPDFGENRRPPAPPAMPGFGPRFFPRAGDSEEAPPEPYDAVALNSVTEGTEVLSDTVFEQVKLRVLTIGLRQGGKLQVAYNMQDVDRL
ncbi:hypothetical protein ABTM44_17885, partial [Acinetobacter baumannii]